MVNINNLRKHAEERRARLEAGGFLPDQPVSDDPALAQRIGESDADYMERLERDHPETVRELQMRFMGYAGQVSDAVRDLFSRTYGTLTLPGVGTFAKLSSGKVGISIADLLGSALQTGALNQMTDAINGASIAALQTGELAQMGATLDDLGGHIGAMAGEAAGAINGVGSAALQAINAGSLAQFAQINETITQAAAAALAAYSPFNDPEFRRQMEETFRQRRDQDSRGYDYSEHHLAPDHPAVTQLMAALDYGAFLDAQEPTGPDHERLIADMRSAIADPEGDLLRRGISHELARRIWANASTGWDYRGDDDPEPDIAELVNTETGEPLELPVTGEFITDIATGEIDRMAAGLDQYNGGDRWPTWRNFRDILTAQSERDILEGIWAGYLESLNALPPAPHYRAAYGADGIGDTPSHGVAYGAIMVQYSGDWQPDAYDHMPTILNQWGADQWSRHSFDRDKIQADAAWEVAERLGDRHADVLDYVQTLWLANRDETATGWGIQLTATDLLRELRYTPHHKGGYEAKQVAEIAAIIYELSLQTVKARIQHFPQRNKPAQTIVETTNLIEVSRTFARLTVTGEERPFAWIIRPGDWAASSFRLTDQHKAANRAILALDGQAQYAKRIGRYLEHHWRVRSDKDDLDRPFVIDSLLRGSRIGLPQNNPKRFRERVEKQLATLQAAGVIAGWSYPDGAVTQGGKRGHAQWLDARIQFVAPSYATHRATAIRSGRRRAIGTKTPQKGQLHT